MAKNVQGGAAAVREVSEREFTVVAPSGEVATALREMVRRVGAALAREAPTVQRKQLADATELFMKLYGVKLNLIDAQLERNAIERAQFAKEYPLLDAERVAHFMGSGSRHPAALASKLKARGKLFSVKVPPHNRDYYPAFQFDATTRQPLPVIAEVLRAIGKRLAGWELALWFATENGWLENDEKPVALLSADPAAVVAAAKREAESPGL